MKHERKPVFVGEVVVQAGVAVLLFVSPGRVNLKVVVPPVQNAGAVWPREEIQQRGKSSWANPVRGNDVAGKLHCATEGIDRYRRVEDWNLVPGDRIY